MSINISLSKSPHSHRLTPWPAQIHLACTQKVNTFKISSTGGETKYQLKRTFLWFHHQTSPKLRVPSFIYLMLHEPQEFDSPVMPSHLSAEMHRASWGPQKLTAPPAQEEPPQQLLTAKEIQLQQSELLTHLKQQQQIQGLCWGGVWG